MSIQNASNENSPWTICFADGEGAAELLHRVFFPLAFITKASENLSIAKYGKAYTRFIAHQEEVS